MGEQSDQPGSITKILADGPLDESDKTFLFRRYYHLVREKARRRVPRSGVADASDLEGQVLDSLFRGLEKGQYSCKDREELEDRLGEITYHKAVNLYHWLKRPIRHPSERIDTGPIIESCPLPEEYRRIAELCYFEEMTEQEIADTLGLGVDIVKQRLAKIRREVQKRRYQPREHASPEELSTVTGGESPLAVVVMKETLVNLEDSLRETALLVMEGSNNRQISERLNVSERQIQRRLKYLKEKWQHELNEDSKEG